MIFRCVGAFFLMIGAVAAVAALIFIFLERSISVFLAVVYSLPTIFLGMSFFGLSRKLAAWVCFDFDKFDDR